MRPDFENPCRRALVQDGVRNGTNIGRAVPQRGGFGLGENGERRHIELGVKGSNESVELAYRQLRQGIRDLGSEFDEP